MDFRVLGPLEVWANGQTLPLGGPRQRALLAVLLLNANRVVSRDRLIDELWDEQPDTPRGALNVVVSRLRKTLAAEDGKSRLVTRPPGYLLRVQAGELDLVHFERLVEHGRRLLRDGEHAAAAETLREADGLWRGDPLADLELERFARPQIERLEELRLTGIEDRVDAELVLGRHSSLAGELEALIAQHPLRERMRGQLMLALYRSDRQAEALEVYAATRALLVEELGLEPAPALHKLQQAILRHEAALDPRPAPEHTRETPAPGQPPRARRAWLLPAAGLAALLAVATVLIADSGNESPGGPVRGDALVLVSPRDAQVVTTLSLRAAPTQIAHGLGAVWVSHSGAASVSRVDPGTRTVRQTIRVGDGPSGVAVAGGNVWVANTLDGTVSRIDPETDTVVQTTEVGSQPSALAVASGDVWVANRGDGTLSRVDARSGQRIATVSVGRGPSDLAASGASLWSANEEDGSVSHVNTASGAVTQTVDVGNAPSAIAATADGVVVLDALDSTLSLVDPARGAVASTTSVDGAAGGLAVADGAAWVTNESGGLLSRVDPRRGLVTDRLRVGDGPATVATATAGLWVGIQGGGRRHRGGTLTVVGPMSGIASVDPAVLDTLVAPPQLLGLMHDGLVTLNHVGGAEGSRLVPDLALALPAAADGGRTYTFHLRPGIRYSNGEPVRARDVRASLERLFELGSSGRSSYDKIVGAGACAPRPGGCDLSRGIVTDDDGGTVTFHLTAADPDFLYKLAQAYAFVLPASTPSREPRAALPATGPYVLRDFQPHSQLRFVRNPRFRQWSRAAQPAGYPDEIVWRFGLEPDRQVSLVTRGAADLMLNVGPAPARQRELLRRRHASQLRVNWSMGTDFFFLNTRVRPFDDVRVRRAVNYAVDRGRAVRIHGGAGNAQPTCQILPPQMPGFRRYCPYTRDPRPDGRWRGPDLERAKRLVAESGTLGMSVGVWTTPEPEIALGQGRYMTSLLRRLGYDASLHVLPERRFLRYTDDSRNRAQVISGGWSADYPSPSTLIGRLRCSYFIPNSTSNTNSGGFCDPALDRRIDRAERLQASHPTNAAALWARLDRELTDRAVWLPTVTGKITDIVSRRVGNYQYHSFWGVLLDQLWVR